MTGADILFLIFVVIPAGIGYVAMMYGITILTYKIQDYLKVRKEFMQAVIEKNKEDAKAPN